MVAPARELKKVLVTGFEPFGGSEINTSQQIADAVGGVVLPVSYARAAGALRAAIRAADPDVVVCFGQADREAVSVERFAHNLDGAESEDNDGAVSAAEIDPDGPAAYRSTLPVDAIVAALRAEDIPAEASRDAGGYLCNHVFYVLMRLLEGERPGATRRLRPRAGGDAGRGPRPGGPDRRRSGGEGRGRVEERRRERRAPEVPPLRGGEPPQLYRQSERA